MTTGKTIALTRQTFVGKVMSLLFNMLSRLIITFPPRGKHLLISWLQLPSAEILEPPKIKSLIVSIVSPSICHEVLEKAMATHSSVLAWRIPGTAEPGRLPSMGSHSVGHDWNDLAAAAAAMGPDAMVLVFWTLNFSHLFHSPLSLWSIRSLVLRFLP